MDDLERSVMEDLKIGSRCTLNYCNQKDFLPYKCKLCSETFCHGHIGDHECSKKNSDDKFAMKCPKCLERIAYTGADDEKLVLEMHQREPKCIKKPQEKCQKCSNCKLKLTLINKYSCNHCGQLTCLKHRARDQHPCKPLSAMITWREMVSAY